MLVRCLNCGTEMDLYRLEHDDNSVDGFYTCCSECGASFDVEFSPSSTFITDVVKMADFKVLTKEEFLSEHNDVTENQYEATILYINWLNADDSEP